MGEPETELIRVIRPKREWLLRCHDNDNRLATCSIGVNRGEIDIYGPEDERISLEPAQIAEFHAALHEAIELAEADLRECRRKRDRVWSGAWPECRTRGPERRTRGVTWRRRG